MIPNVKNEKMIFFPLTLNLDSAYPAVALNATINISEIPVTFRLFHIYRPILPSESTFTKFSRVGFSGNANGADDSSTVGFILAINSQITG